MKMLKSLSTINGTGSAVIFPRATNVKDQLGFLLCTKCRAKLKNSRVTNEITNLLCSSLGILKNIKSDNIFFLNIRLAIIFPICQDTTDTFLYLANNVISSLCAPNKTVYVMYVIVKYLKEATSKNENIMPRTKQYTLCTL